MAAARYLSSVEGATIGGDLYDVCLEGHTRFIVGDVKGKGIAAVEQAARVIRAFRQTAAARAQLADVASGMHRYLAEFFGDEEFATALLVELGPTHTDQLRTPAGHPRHQPRHGHLPRRTRRAPPRHRGRFPASHHRLGAR